ncbi:response regulator transcription factor [Pleurocapsa sp. PCC 7319]|uniref:response regulator n=1 Tax=Pleurocapsa sp. PCC 7319 TaxID=118161 RepID=UPI00034D0BBA|nr:response regulator transcription factor [Pleurocapsa sp. PCC 7319]
MIKTLIVDDQNTVRQILRNYLENEVDISIVGFATDGQAALKQLETLKPDVIVMDIEMSMMDGFAAAQIIREQYLSTKIIFFTNFDDINYFNQALKAGANGYLLKRSSPEEIKSAIRTVYYGSFHLNTGLLKKYLDNVSRTSSNSPEIAKLQEMLSQQSSLIRGLIPKSQHKIIESQQPTEELDIKTELARIGKKIRILERTIDDQTRFLNRYYPKYKTEKNKLKKIKKIFLIWLSILSFLEIFSIFYLFHYHL